MMLELGETSGRNMNPRKDSRANILLVNCLTFGSVLSLTLNCISLPGWVFRKH